MSETSSVSAPLLQVRQLCVSFQASGGRRVQAVRGVNLDLAHGQVLGLVGESGCGKSTLARAILQLQKVDSGSVTLQGTELCTLSERQLRPLRPLMQMVFQDPYASLNPRMSIRDLLAEPRLAHGLSSSKDSDQAAAQLLDLVGLPANAALKYPHEFSGGQRQRIAIARALALKPALLIADEPVSALDVSVQAQIINLLQDLVRELNFGLLFIAHDLSVVKHLSDQIALMYLGQIVEQGDAEHVIEAPLHPYAKALTAAIPVPDPARQPQVRSLLLAGDPPSPLNPPTGCAFHPRCPRRIAECSITTPRLLPQADSRLCACHNP